MISGVEINLTSGRARCSARGGAWACGDADVNVSEGDLIEVTIRGRDLDEGFPASLELDLDFVRALALSADSSVDEAYAVGFRYYNALGAGREPRSPRPPDEVDYPTRPRGEGPRAWAYPSWPASPEEVPPYTELLLAEQGDGTFVALLGISSGKLTGFLGPGPRVSIYSGRSEGELAGAVAAVGRSRDPYSAVAASFEAASRTGLTLRKSKGRPSLLDGLGWCTWNAFLSDLSSRAVVEAVSEMMRRGLRLSWVLIDDGWQLVEKAGEAGAPALADISEDRAKLGDSIGRLAASLKGLGVRSVGLWVTVNGYWGGLSSRLAARYGAVRLRGGQAFASLGDGVRRFYGDLAAWARSQGADFLKVDNQVWLHSAFSGLATSAEASREVLHALQEATYANGLEVLSCMGVVPESYSNQSRANVMRACSDYIPFWRGGAKLHAVFAAYSALLVSNVSYPDFDMFMSYDPYALAYLVLALLSGGPLYITDRDPSRTNVGLLRRALLSDGSVARADEPGLPTRDVLFRNPYVERVLLKLASTASGVAVVGAVNVNREGRAISEVLSPSSLPRPLGPGRVAYYLSVSGGEGVSEGVPLSLGELEAEVATLVPADGLHVIGIKELLVPPAGVSVSGRGGRLVVTPRADGTLVYYDGSGFAEERVSCCREVELG